MVTASAFTWERLLPDVSNGLQKYLFNKNAIIEIHKSTLNRISLWVAYNLDCTIATIWYSIIRIRSDRVISKFGENNTKLSYFVYRVIVIAQKLARSRNLLLRPAASFATKVKLLRKELLMSLFHKFNTVCSLARPQLALKSQMYMKI